MLTLAESEVAHIAEHLAELDLLIEEDDGTFFSTQFLFDHDIMKKLFRGENT